MKIPLGDGKRGPILEDQVAMLHIKLQNDAEEWPYLLRGCVADKSKASGLSSGILHHLGRCDCPMGSKLSTQLVIVYIIAQVLDVQVHALVFGNLFLTSIIKSAG